MQFSFFCCYKKITFGPIWAGTQKGSRLDPNGPKGSPIGPKGSPMGPEGPFGGRRPTKWGLGAKPPEKGLIWAHGGPKGEKKRFFSSGESPT